MNFNKNSPKFIPKLTQKELAANFGMLILLNIILSFDDSQTLCIDENLYKSLMVEVTLYLFIYRKASSKSLSASRGPPISFISFYILAQADLSSDDP